MNLGQDFISCDKCGCEEFKEEKRMKISYVMNKKIRTSQSQPLTGRLVEDEGIVYICTECGTKLNI